MIGPSRREPAENFELLRSGFLKDGRYFSIELLPRYGMWVARLVFVPGNWERAVRRAAYKPDLQRWASRLTLAEIEAMAPQY